MSPWRLSAASLKGEGPDREPFRVFSVADGFGTADCRAKGGGRGGEVLDWGVVGPLVGMGSGVSG
jgi:hypothetical protein